MGLFLCDLCDKDLGGFTSSSVEHVCNREDILKRIKTLANSAWKAENHLATIRSKTQLLIKELPSLDEEEVIVKTKWLQDLWKATEAHHNEGEGGSPTEFLSLWLFQQRVLCEAFDLFRSKTGRMPETALVKLQNLRKVCDEAKAHIYPGGSPFDISPQDIIDEILYSADYDL